MARIRRGRQSWIKRIPLAVRVAIILALCFAVGYGIWNYERWVNPTTYWRNHATRILHEAEVTCRVIRRGEISSEEVERRLLAWAEVASDFGRDMENRKPGSAEQVRHFELTNMIISSSLMEAQFAAWEEDLPVRPVFGFDPEIGPFAEMGDAEE